MKTLLSSCHLCLVHLLGQSWPQNFFPGEQGAWPALEDAHQARQVVTWCHLNRNRWNDVSWYQVRIQARRPGWMDGDTRWLWSACPLQLRFRGSRWTWEGKMVCPGLSHWLVWIGHQDSGNQGLPGLSLCPWWPPAQCQGLAPPYGTAALHRSCPSQQCWPM